MGDTCCCGRCSVETGTMIIAFVDIILSCTIVIKNGLTVNTMIRSPEDIPEDLYPLFNDHRAIYVTVMIGSALLALFFGVASGLLLIGARVRNYKQCAIWLYWNYVGLSVTAVFGTIFCCVVAITGLYALAGVYFFLLVAGLALAGYFVCVVKRFAAEVKAE